MMYTYFSQVQGLILFYDIADRDSIIEVKYLYLDMQDAVDETFYCIIGGLNLDLRQEDQQVNLIPESEIEELSKDLKCEIIEVSSKTGENIDKLFVTLVREILNSESNEAATDINLYKIKGDWNIGLYNVEYSVADDLARKYVFGEVIPIFLRIISK
ncbi:hypothetical protein M9Y10_020956 [Tritrichomonas musculus]|uniref:Uncharacterized protein n=1 Tax=Tritrichomonas musculus TaxID=1915356 RepID=A0ABR2HF25_9EUKA